MSVADELTKLVALRDSGVITPEEFDQQRAIVLATATQPAAIPEPAPPTRVQWGPTDAAPHGAACGRCGKPLSPAWRGKCNHCGAAYAQFPPVGGVALPTVPVAASNARRNLGLGCLGVAVAVVVLVMLGGNRTGPGGTATSRPATAVPVTKNLVGTFLRWEPVDDENGYAYFSVKNNGKSTAKAECTITVRNDFGNFGFDILVGEQVGPGETFSGRMAINVGEGSLLINEGEVTDC